jgi:hypothetical protein
MRVCLFALQFARPLCQIHILDWQNPIVVQRPELSLYDLYCRNAMKKKHFIPGISETGRKKFLMMFPEPWLVAFCKKGMNQHIASF